MLEKLLADSGAESKGKVIVGTVKGDLHDIGKNLVGMMMQGGGLEVIDLGTDVSADTFVNAVKENKAKLLAMSSLLTTTMPYMSEVIQAVRKEGLKDVQIMIGGAPVTQQFADEIKANGYAPDAASAVELALQLLRRAA